MSFKPREVEERSEIHSSALFQGVFGRKLKLWDGRQVHRSQVKMKNRRFDEKFYSRASCEFTKDCSRVSLQFLCRS